MIAIVAVSVVPRNRHTFPIISKEGSAEILTPTSPFSIASFSMLIYQQETIDSNIFQQKNIGESLDTKCSKPYDINRYLTTERWVVACCPNSLWRKHSKFYPLRVIYPVRGSLSLSLRSEPHSTHLPFFIIHWRRPWQVENDILRFDENRKLEVPPDHGAAGARIMIYLVSPMQ